MDFDYQVFYVCPFVLSHGTTQCAAEGVFVKFHIGF
jgi:hypothetical protein